ncbi:ABC-2 transporter permease [Metabacillus malikii]|uniref:Membrane protein n=1 Tax=Metabacillus malikii TaxID=1504265 RepID=A0ABT9ZKP0_9BACI|nr:ABC-2 transporter permease [Metabacillus malikii]MDQ0231785.1 putative membrane protein [Metabacillus malikii]
MNRLAMLVTTIIFLSFNILLIRDFFPNSSFNNDTLGTILITIIVLGLLSAFFIPDLRKTNNEKVTFKGIILNLCLFVYIILAIISLEIFGGQSRNNISLSNPILLVFLVVHAVKIYSDFRNYKKGKDK